MGLLEQIQSNILIGDGAIGTYLYTKGHERCFEQLNLTNPSKVIDVHQAYIKAGSQVIQTNTYAANRIKLANYELEDQVVAINKSAVQCAKAAAKDNVFVLGTIGGIKGFQTSNYTEEEIMASFEQQLSTLLEEAIDGILLETYYDFDEIVSCLKLARNMTNKPIIAHVSLDEVGVLHGGLPLNDALLTLEQLGANIVGLNCRMGPYHMIRSLESIPLLSCAHLSAYPNASLPDYKDGRLVYQSNPEYFGKSAQEFVKQGVRLIGGCCGTTPEHITYMREAIEDIEPITHKKVEKKVTNKITIVTKDDYEPLHVKANVQKSVIVELDPPKKLQVDKFLLGAKELLEVGQVDAITLADNSLASPRICNLSLATMLKAKFHTSPLVHITCRDRNLIGLQSHLMGLHTLGMNRVLAVTGDPTKMGDFPGATSVYDLASFDFIKLIKKMNEGYSFSGKDLGKKTNFSVGAAFNPNVKNLDQAVKRVEKKVACGADYFLTQPIYSRTQIKEVYEATKHLSVPVYIGVMPLISSRNAEFLHNEVPGIKLTPSTRKRMELVKDDSEASIREGLNISKELIDEVYQYFNGLYLITPFLKYEMTVELAQYWHKKEAMIGKKETTSMKG